MRYGLFLFLSLIASPAYANNMAVANVELVNQDNVNDTWDIQFDIAWDNSWFIAGAPAIDANWDAAWVFAKFSKFTLGSWSDWAHCTLLDTYSSAPAGSQIAYGKTGAITKGMFVYRSAAGSGSVDWDDAEIRWDYGEDGVLDHNVVKVRLFAIEMAYVPEGNFYVGDDTSTGTMQDKDDDNPALIDTNPNVIYCANTSYDDAQFEGAGILVDGDGGIDQDGTTAVDNADYPTGYSAFYIMKYEISQRQYCEFLNTLTSAQATTRFPNQYGNHRHYIKKAADGTYGCDAGNDAGASGSADSAQLNEADDGEWVACNYMSWADNVAYADWAALRPFTELEYEKACRGGAAVVAGEYAWGSTNLTQATGITNAAASNEVSSNAANCVYGNHGSVQGPIRSGGLTDADDSREEAGAAAYGAMDLSGNLWERPVTMGHATGRAYTGVHGDGTLDATGDADTTNWPGTAATGSGFRGGYWADVATLARVSDRYSAANVSSARAQYRGARSSRTSP